MGWKAAVKGVQCGGAQGHEESAGRARDQHSNIARGSHAKTSCQSQ